MSDPAELLKGTTPGPWYAVERIRPHRRTTWWVNIGGKYLAEMVPETGLVGSDARLIAAAPELAQFVSDYLAYYRRGYPNPHEAENLARRARAILARAPTEDPPLEVPA